MDRITRKHLDFCIDTINTLTNSPMTYCTRVGDNFKCNIGNYHIYSAYGSVGLHRTMNEGGGVHTIIELGTKRELYNQLKAFIKGLEASKEV